MSYRDGNVTVICAEPDDVCALCGKVAELRPYGPDYARICFECAMKDEAGAEQRMREVLYGEKPAN